MNKVRIFFRLFAILMALTVFPVEAQDLSSLSKAEQKEYKATLRNLKKEGYTVYASKRSLEEALLLHYEKLYEKDGNTEAIGTASNVVNKSLGHNKAMLNAQNSYLQDQQASISSTVAATKKKGDEGNERTLDAAFQSDVQQQLHGELTETFCVVREEKEKAQNGKPLYTMMVFMVAKAK